MKYHAHLVINTGPMSEKEVSRFLSDDPWSNKQNIIGGDLCDLVARSCEVIPHEGKARASFVVNTRLKVEDNEHLSEIIDDTLHYYNLSCDWDNEEEWFLDMGVRGAEGKSNCAFCMSWEHEVKDCPQLKDSGRNSD